MPAISASAPGKIILLGEHSVVHGRPAIAVPVSAVQARAAVFANPIAPTGQVRIQAPAIDLDAFLTDLPADHLFAIGIQGVLEHFGLNQLPACTIRIQSTIPIAAGMGSSAAVSVALIRAVSTFLGHPLDNEAVNAIAFKVEQRIHGNPSGVDNSVITYNQPVYFIRGQEPGFITVREPVQLLVTDSGTAAATGPMVEGVKQRHQASPHEYDAWFDRIGALVDKARDLLEIGLPDALGPLLTENHFLLQKIGVSTPELDRLVEAALGAGALGAKLTGGGGGGNMIAQVTEGTHDSVKAALLVAGARMTWLTVVAPHRGQTP